MAKIGGKKYDIEYIVGTDDQTKQGLQSAEKGMEKFAKRSDGLLTSMRKNWLLLGGAIGGITGAVSFAKGALDTASSFEQMAIQLDVLTKGRGISTLDKINKWALEMPVNTQEAVQSFVQMTAFGLNPTIKSMEILTDVASVFGQDALPRVSRALGQMKALGKLSAEELNQLSEVGINAREILFDAFGQSVEEIQKSGRNIDEVINALWKGMDEKFGGAAKKAMTSWEGMTAVTKSYITEISRALMTDSGAFQMLKNVLGDINTELENNMKWTQRNISIFQMLVGVTGSVYGKFKELADLTAEMTTEPFFWKPLEIAAAAMELSNLKKELKEINKENAEMAKILGEKRLSAFEGAFDDATSSEYKKILEDARREREMNMVNGKSLESLIPSLDQINKDIGDASEKAYKEMYGRLEIKTKDWVAAEIAELQKLRDWWALFDEDLANQLFSEGQKKILQEFIDSRMKTPDAAGEETAGQQMGKRFGESMGMAVENSLSDAMYGIFTGDGLQVESLLEGFGRSMARIISDAFAEAATAPLKNALSSIFSIAFAGIGAGVTGGLSGSFGGTPGAASTNPFAPTGASLSSSVAPSRQGDSNRITINTYIYEDAMLEKKVNNVVSKAIRNNSAISKQMRNN